MSMKNVMVVTPTLGAGTEICYRIPFEILCNTRAITYRIFLEYHFQQEDLAGVSVLILYRCLQGRTLTLANYARKKGIKVIYEMDDDLLDPPEDETWGKRYRRCGFPHIVGRFLKTAHQVKAGSPVLVERLGNQGIESIYQPYAVRARKNPPLRSGPPYRIGYFGTPHHQPDISSIFPALQTLEEEFGDDVEFEFFGCVPQMGHKLKQIRVWKFNPDYERFLDDLSEREWTVGLAPLRPTRFNEAKSNSKFREFAAIGVPAVYSDLKPYRECVDHWKNGLLCGWKPENWVDTVKEVIQNAERWMMVNKAQSYVAVYHNPQFAADNWAKLIEP